MPAISRNDGLARSVDTKIIQHASKAVVGTKKQGAVSSKRRRGYKIELDKAFLRSSLNLGRFCTVWGAYGQVGGAFATWSGALSRLFRGAFRHTQGKEKGNIRGEQEKQNSARRIGGRAPSRTR